MNPSENPQGRIQRYLWPGIRIAIPVLGFVAARSWVNQSTSTQIPPAAEVAETAHLDAYYIVGYDDQLFCQGVPAEFVHMACVKVEHDGMGRAYQQFRDADGVSHFAIVDLNGAVLHSGTGHIERQEGADLISIITGN